jgi:tripeptidyl-peptidase-1
MRFSLLAIAAFAVTALAAPSPARHVLLEKRSITPHGWVRKTGLQGSSIIPMKIALAQSNMDKLEDYLMEVSHPDSDKFAQHWSAEQIADTFAPSQDTLDAVRNWLVDSGISAERVKTTASKGWLQFMATVDEAERLLKTKYHAYEHTSSGTPRVGCDAYYVPEHVRQHVDFITPTVHFDTKILPPRDNGLKLKKRYTKLGAPGNGFMPKIGASLDPAAIGGLTCGEAITPACLRQLYKMPHLTKSVQTNGYGIVEYSPQAYLQTDLTEFFLLFQPTTAHQSPIVDSIDGGYAQTTNISFAYNGESDLDLEYAMTLSDPVPITLYQVGDPYFSGSFNTFLDAIDGSYCTFRGGDDPSQDPQYPDTSGLAGAYAGPNQCGVFKPASVISTSYGYNEADLTPAYEQRQCAEYAKLGMRGSTILYSSGDYGVAGNGGQCIDPTTGAYNNGTSGKFNPSFPGGCPYVTSVGATQVPTGSTPTQPETACETVIYSGGGFSNVFAMPSYQSTAVASYYKNYKPPYGADRYNNSMMVRGFPDVSANGANYVIVLDGAPNLI